eukprot:3697156-Rhodomonas_salina.5
MPGTDVLPVVAVYAMSGSEVRPYGGAIGTMSGTPSGAMSGTDVEHTLVPVVVSFGKYSYCVYILQFICFNAWYPTPKP